MPTIGDLIKIYLSTQEKYQNDKDVLNVELIDQKELEIKNNINKIVSQFTNAKNIINAMLLSDEMQKIILELVAVWEELQIVKLSPDYFENMEKWEESQQALDAGQAVLIKTSETVKRDKKNLTFADVMSILSVIVSIIGVSHSIVQNYVKDDKIINNYQYTYNQTQNVFNDFIIYAKEEVIETTEQMEETTLTESRKTEE